MPSTDRRPPLSAVEAAKYLGLTHRHILSLRTRHEIPYIKLGRLVRFDPDQLDAWINARRHGEAAAK